MEDNFSVTWEDSGTVVQTEEVICGIENDIETTSDLDPKSTEVLSQEIAGDDQEIVYLTEDQMLVVEPSEQYVTTVSEEIVTEQWDESCPEEIVVGSEEAVITGDSVPTEDIEIPLPTDQDEYTTSRPYPCDFCSRRFRKKANLMNHMVAHQTDRPHGCNLCGVRYIRKCDLMNHLKIHAYIPETDGLDEEDIQPLDESDSERRNKRPKPFIKRKKYKIKEEYDTSYEHDDTMASSSRSYNYVDEDVRLMEAMSHNNVYQDYVHQGQETRYPITDPKKPFVCQHCGVGFAREKALASHARIHGGDSPFECQKCGDMFWDLSKLREHVRAKHGGELELDDEDEDDDYSDEETRYGTFYCSICGLSFHRQDNLKRHQRVHVKEEYINDHEFGHICNVCGESFAEALDLLAHAEVHARTTEHRCMICGEMAQDPQSVAAHVQAKHGKSLPPNTCMLCGRTCKDRRTLLKHSWEHSKEKSFACSKCGKTFHNKARLKRHMLSHRNKIVACDVCGEEFPDGRTLMNHRHSHSSISGRQFPCRECGKTFGSRSSQQIHIRIHTGERPYGCRFCWKAFADGGTLRKHERIHTGEKPYACAVCPRAFNQRVVLREHIRSHHSGPDPKYSHSVTPYCCSVCSDMFATSQDLITHLIHHCDMNTAMKRQPQVGPRKYKRRRKLKPHELELISNKMEEHVVEDDMMDEQQMQQQEYNQTDSEEERERNKRMRKSRNVRSPRTSLSECYTEIYNSCSSAIDNIDSLVKSTKQPIRKKVKTETPVVPSRPKMIHTQKQRVAVETTEDGKIRHKTKTLVTRTQPAEIKSATGERIRPRTKNVSYHILTGDKLQLATFGDEELTQEAVTNLLKENEGLSGDNGDLMEETKMEQIETGPVPTNIIKITASPAQLHNLRPGRTIIGPGTKMVRLVKGGMIITKSTNRKEVTEETEPENILPDFDEAAEIVSMPKERLLKVKQEPVDAGSLHELAELSMQHAQNQFKCEMCSAVFSDRAKLLDHVPIHI